jgi:hypothetical protein
MRPFWKIAASVLCIVLLAGAAIVWRMHSAKLQKLKLTDDAKAFQTKAEQGDAESQTNLASMYEYGSGVPQDFTEAVRWYRTASDQGNARAQFGLGSMYYYGRGEPQDFSEALRWYRKSADQGYGRAQNGLGFMYAQGTAVSQDYSEAVRWYRRAADQGDAKAEYNLGRMYYYGNGLPQNRTEARRLFLKAADQGDEYALRTVSEQLSTLGKYRLLIQFCLGLWCALDFVSFNYLEPNKGLKSVRQKVITVCGVLYMLSAGLEWYGYTHFMFRRLDYGITWSTWLRWSISTIWIALFLYFLWSRKRIDPQTKIVADETSP